MSSLGFFQALRLLLNWQRVLVYPSGFLIQPGRPRVIYTPSDFDLPYEDVVLTTKDKVKLHCYLIRSKDASRSANARGTVILFHGNAMNHGDILPYAKLLYHKNFNVFTLEYRGYGLNKGTPSEWGLQRDGQAAVDYVLSHPELSKLPLIIYGQSLGGAIAIHATYKNSDKVAALIIENTFTSIPDIIKDIPVVRHISFLCTQRWQSAKKVARLPPTLPILMLAGLQDQVIPYSHTEKLWEVSESRGRPKPKKSRWKLRSTWGKGAAATEEVSGEEDGKGVPLAKNKHRFFPGGSHNDTYTKSRYWQTVYEFLDDVFVP